MKRRRSQVRRVRGFTLIELILVMLILAIAAAMVVPSLRMFSIGRSTDNIATLIVTLSNYARTQAIGEGRTYRLNFDAQAGEIWLTAADGGAYLPPKNDYAERFKVPPGMKLDVNVTPQPNTLMVSPPDAVQQTVQNVPPYGQPLGQPNNVIQNQHENGTYIEFQSSGRTDPVLIKLTDKAGTEITLGCASATESVHVLGTAEKP